MMLLLLSATWLMAEIRTGVVRDNQGEPIPGVSVRVEGKDVGTVTDVDGKFSIFAEPGDELVFSFVGRVNRTLAIGSENDMGTVTMGADVEQLEDVVVVGYGAMNRDKIGSSIDQIRATELEQRSAGFINIEQVLGGQIKGLQITQTSGAVGSESTFNIRGITSPFGGSTNQPLIVIDGVPFFVDPILANSSFAQVENPLLTIDHDNIETVSTLKDAAATAIYGSRGANGVVLITTKRGKRASAPEFTIKQTTSISNPIKLHDVLNAEDYKKLMVMIANNTIDAYNAGKTRKAGYDLAKAIMDPDTRQLRDKVNDIGFNETYSPFGNANTNWQDEVFRKNAVSNKLSINLRGGTQSTSYFASLSYTNQDALSIKSNYQRYGIRASVDSDVKKWLRVGTNLNYNVSTNRTGQNYTAGYGATDRAALFRPDYPVYDSNGFFQRAPNYVNGVGDAKTRNYTKESNPVAQHENEIDRNAANFTGSVYAELKPIEGLTFRADANAGAFDTKTERFEPLRAKDLYSPFLGQTLRNYILDGSSSVRSVSTDLQLSYDKTFFDHHRVTVLLGYALDRYSNDNTSYSFRETPDDYVLKNPTSAKEFGEARGGSNESGINSYYSRIQYSFANTYNVVANLRTDRSTRFGPGKDRAWFPSIAVNWNIARMSFMRSIPTINRLALRGSYGLTGSSNVSDFNFLQFFEIGLRSNGQYGGAAAITPSATFPNKNIGWESTSEVNLGLDFGLFKSRIYGTLDVYRKVTDDVIAPTPIFLETGQTTYTSNLAAISNKGIEVEIGGDIIRNKDITWSASFIYAKNVGIVEKIKDANLSTTQFRIYQEGEKIGNLFARKVLGIFKSQAEVDELNKKSPNGFYQDQYTTAGDFKYEDVNGDGRITSDDLTKVGNSQPDFFGGFSTSFRYKDLTLFVGFQYTVGVDKRYSLAGPLLYNNDDLDNMGTDALKMWSPTNKGSKIPRIRWGYYANDDLSSAFIFDASYLRLKSVNLNYRLPTKWTQGILKSLDVFVAGGNLLTFTSYPGLDPESSYAKSITGGGVDYSTHPFARTFTFGLKISL